MQASRARWRHSPPVGAESRLPDGHGVGADECQERAALLFHGASAMSAGSNPSVHLVPDDSSARRWCATARRWRGGAGVRSLRAILAVFRFQDTNRLLNSLA